MIYRPGILPRVNLDAMATQMEFELTVISRLLNSLPKDTVYANVSVAGLKNQTAVTTGGTFIPLSPNIPNYVILFRCVNSSNEGVGCDITGQSAGGFTATPLENATLHWAALPI